MTPATRANRTTMATSTRDRSSTTRPRTRAALASAAITGALVLFAASCGDDTPAADTASSGAPGAELYAANCASCHGDDLRGTDRGPSQLSIVYEPSHHPDDSYRSAIENGVRQHHWGFGNMPPISGLQGADVDEIIAFIRAEQQRQGFEPSERP